MSFLNWGRPAEGGEKTGKIIAAKSRFSWFRWLFPITGLAALVWFLIRVIPKPSRATYPCQRVAFPLASGFIIWLMGLAGSALAWRKAKQYFLRARYVVAIVCVSVSVGIIWLAASAAWQDNAKAAWRTPQPANEPIGVARGIHPGRVAWIHDANSTDWAGPMSGQRWYSNQCTDQARVDKMLSRAIRALAAESTDEAAWDRIFRYFNRKRGKGNVAYTPGEKITIKINHTLSFGSDPCTMDKSDEPWHQDPPFIDCIDNSPQLTISLLRQLIDVVGVAPGDIAIGDPGRIMPNYWYDMVEPNCPGVVYIARVGGKGRTQSQWSDTKFYFSDPNASHWTDVNQQDHIPHCFADADYFINFPVMKSHQNGGITVCAKNLYGALIRNPNASDQPNPGDWYNMHITLPGPIDSYPGVPGMGNYRCLVDLMTHPELGGKTLVYLVDALFAGQGWDGVPSIWNIEPFSGDWPSSVFISQDGVAIDSVCFDFLLAEWPKNPGADMAGSDDYLHEAALIPDPPSGTNYDPNNDGGLTESFGVHEHWNNASDKQYSRNLDPVNGRGIELVKSSAAFGDIDGDGGVDFEDFALLMSAWQSSTGESNWDQRCDISEPGDGVIDEADLSVLSQNWLGGFPGSVIANGAQLEVAYSEPGIYFEGPSWDLITEKLYFSQRTEFYRILRLDSPGSVTVWMNNTPQTNGTFLANDGRLLTADESTKQICNHRIGASGPEDSQVLAGPADGINKKPNDLCQTPRGDIYFTGPDWSAGATGQVVYRLSTDGQVTEVIGDMEMPNGIIASNDGTKLYVSDSNLKHWKQYPINPDGSVGAGWVFFDPDTADTHDPDGMTIDELGNLYFVGLGGLWIVSPDGIEIDMLAIPEFCSNVTFGGPDGRTLYITCQDKVYSLAMRVRGGSWADRTAPSPDPMDWATAPQPSGPYSIRMTAATASDKFGVEYYFANETDPSHDSGWQDSPDYNDTGLDRGTIYTYRVKARDKSDSHNETSYSQPASSTTQLEAPPIAFNSNSCGFATTAGSTLSFTHTIGSGQNRLLAVGIQSENPSGSMSNLIITSIRYNGANLLKAGHTYIDEGANVLAVELWYLLEADLPPAGTYTVNITYSGTVQSRSAGAISLENVLQAPPEDVNSSTVVSSPISTTVSCSDGSWVIDAVGCGNISAFTPAAGGMTKRYEVSATSNSGAGSTTTALAAGPVPVQWSNDNANALAQVAAAFRPLP